MTSTALILLAVDLVAALTLTLGLYYRRHHRRDLVVAFLGVNVGVLAVAAVLGTAEVALGLGLGIFGVLSIIRLRSSEVSQREVAYYFAALAMGLMAGLPQTDPWPVAGLIALVLTVMWAADHPAVLSRARHQVVRLDRAIADEAELRTELAARLGAEVTSLTVQELDLVDDTTLVDVRYRMPRSAARRPAADRADGPSPFDRLAPAPVPASSRTPVAEPVPASSGTPVAEPVEGPSSARSAAPRHPEPVGAPSSARSAAPRHPEPDPTGSRQTRPADAEAALR